jgi:hypothetical protein
MKRMYFLPVSFFLIFALITGCTSTDIASGADGSDVNERLEIDGVEISGYYSIESNQEYLVATIQISLPESDRKTRGLSYISIKPIIDGVARTGTGQQFEGFGRTYTIDFRAMNFGEILPLSDFNQDTRFSLRVFIEEDISEQKPDGDEVLSVTFENITLSELSEAQADISNSGQAQNKADTSGPEILSPESGQVISELNFSLIWSPANDESIYTLEESRSREFEYTDRSWTIDGKTTFDIGVPKSNEYYYRIRAGNQAWSEIIEVVVEAGAQEQDVQAETIQSQPILSSTATDDKAESNIPSSLINIPTPWISIDGLESALPPLNVGVLLPDQPLESFSEVTDSPPDQVQIVTRSPDQPFLVGSMMYSWFRTAGIPRTDLFVNEENELIAIRFEITSEPSDMMWNTVFPGNLAMGSLESDFINAGFLTEGAFTLFDDRRDGIPQSIREYRAGNYRLSFSEQRIAGTDEESQGWRLISIEIEYVNRN